MQAFAMSDDVELLGMGIGLATNVGAVRSVGEKGFIVAEGAWPAMVGELGPILGFALIVWRVAMTMTRCAGTPGMTLWMAALARPIGRATLPPPAPSRLILVQAAVQVQMALTA